MTAGTPVMCAGCGAMLEGSDVCTACGTQRGEGASSQPPLAARFHVGALYAGRYQVQGVLGQGGMGVVLRVRDQQTGGEAALKVLLGNVAEEPASVERFVREAEILRRLQHPAIPRLLASGRHEGEAFLVTELVHGLDLRRSVPAGERMAVRRCVEIATEVACALAAAHEAGVVHRDVKPQNILLDEAGHVHLVDFGVAHTSAGGLETLTRTGAVLGTPAYMSPEQVESHHVDPRSDVYSLGIVLFELLTGRLPFQAPSLLTMILAHRDQPVPSPRALDAVIPLWLDRLVLRCLTKQPADRVGSATALAKDLREGLARGQARRRRLPSGDFVLEDPNGVHALVLTTPRPRPGWSEGMALRFEDQHYKLVQVELAPSGATYRFLAFPDAEVMRKHVDYAADLEAHAVDDGWRGRIRRLFGGEG